MVYIFLFFSGWQVFSLFKTREFFRSDFCMPYLRCFLNRYWFLDAAYWPDWNKACQNRPKPCKEGRDRDIRNNSLLSARCFTHFVFPHTKGRRLQTIHLLRFEISLHDTSENLKPCFPFSPNESRESLRRDLIEKVTLKPSQLILYVAARTESY